MWTGAFKFDLSGDEDASSEEKEIGTHGWESSPVLLESLASIINKNRVIMMGLTLRDFASATGGSSEFSGRFSESNQG